jgi:hypothetical protein
MSETIQTQPSVDEISLDLIKSLKEEVKLLDKKITLLEKTCDWQDREINELKQAS